MLRPELLQLNFDTCERLGAIAGTLEDFAWRPDDTVLDVGGHPGLLASILEGRARVTTVDFPPTGRSPYLRASGDNLPFRAASFDAVVASDTLEHVPPAVRRRFLAEMWRVARRVVLVGGPYATPGAAHAEQRLRELEARLRAAPDRWLAEHAEHGLPDLHAAWDGFESSGAVCAALPNGILIRWFLLFAARFVLEDLPGGVEALNTFIPDYNRLFGTDPLGPSAVAYRHLLVACKGQPLPSALADRSGVLLTRSSLPEAATGTSARVVEGVDALSRLFQALAAAQRAQLTSSGSGSVPDQQYVEQIERALQRQNERLQDLEAQLRVRATPSLAERVARRLGRVFRRASRTGR